MTDLPRTEKMPAATLEALKGSIRKWEKIVAGDGADQGPDNCPLCQLFWEGDCDGCPVVARTKRGFCSKSPYTRWVEASERAGFFARGDFTIKIPTPPSAKEHRAMRRAAQAELDFLKSLLPEGESL